MELQPPIQLPYLLPIGRIGHQAHHMQVEHGYTHFQSESLMDKFC